MSLLTVRGVHGGYGDTLVLRGVDLEVAEGEVLCLLGRNGAGKSTLLQHIVGLLRPAAGTILWRGRRLIGVPPHAVADLGIRYAPQENALFLNMSVRDNLRLAHGRRPDFARELAWAVSLFPALGERLGQRAGTLSGGEQKQLITARALMCRPQLVLLDEVSEGVQPTLVRIIGSAIAAACRERGAAAILVEQNLGFALGVAQRYAIMERGAIVSAGVVTPELDPAALANHLKV